MTQTATAPSRRILTRWLIQLTRPVLTPLAFSALCRIADQLLAVALIGYASYHLVAAVGAVPSAEELVHIVLVLAGISLAKAALRYAEQFLGHWVAFRALEVIRTRVFGLLVPQSPAISRMGYSGDLLSRLTRDIDRIEVFFAHTFAPAISALVVPAIMVGCTGAVLGWLPAAVMAANYLLGLIIVLGWGVRRSQQAADAALTARGELTQFVTDSVQGVEEIVGYGQEAHRVEQLGDYEQTIQQAQTIRARASMIRVFCVNLLHYCGAVGVAAAALHTQDELPVATIALVVGFAAAFYRSWDAVTAVEGFTSAVDQSFAGARRIYGLEQAGFALPDEGAALPQQAPEIRFDQVSFRYPSPRCVEPVLQQLSFTVPAGQWVAVIGPTGCGKSTVAALTARYFDPDEGQISIAGVPLHTLDRGQLRQSMVVLTQRSHIFSGTVASNLRLAAPDASEDQLWEVLAAVELADEIRQLPQGINTAVGGRLSVLSGGQRQRLALARALLLHPQVLVLDEFTAHLDACQAQRMRALVRNYFPAATVLEITHRLAQLSGVDQLLVFDAGRLVEQGSPAELARERKPGEPETIFQRLLQRSNTGIFRRKTHS